MSVFANLLLSASVIAFATWLSKTYPVVAGFVIALPLTTMLVLPLSHVQHDNPENTFLLAKSIFIAIPVSLTFFVPFLLAPRFGLSFWQAYGAGCVLLAVGYFVHQAVTHSLFQPGA
jgi:hypothetical protein